MGLGNDWEKKVHHRPMQNFIRYNLTKNGESQVVAWASADMADTGGKAAILNNVPLTLAQDAAYDVSAELPYGDWAASTAYTTMGASDSEVVGKDGKHYVCILAHTSSAAGAALEDSNEPGIGWKWETYWKVLDKWAEAAAGWVMAANDKWYVLICKMADGTLRAFKASDGVAGTRPFVCPAYDPERYVPVAIAYIQAAGAVTIGTTDASGVTTVTQITGVLLPDADQVDKN